MNDHRVSFLAQKAALSRGPTSLPAGRVLRPPPPPRLRDLAPGRGRPRCRRGHRQPVQRRRLLHARLGIQPRPGSHGNALPRGPGERGHRQPATDPHQPYGLPDRRRREPARGRADPGAGCRPAQRGRRERPVRPADALRLTGQEHRRGHDQPDRRHRRQRRGPARAGRGPRRTGSGAGRRGRRFPRGRGRRGGRARQRTGRHRPVVRGPPGHLRLAGRGWRQHPDGTGRCGRRPAGRPGLLGPPADQQHHPHPGPDDRPGRRDRLLPVHPGPHPQRTAGADPWRTRSDGPPVPPDRPWCSPVPR